MSHVLSELSHLAAGGLFARETAEPPCAKSRPAQANALAAADSFLPAELVHGIEAVVTPTSPQVRSAAVASVVEEIFTTVEWLHGGDADRAELASLAQVLAAARAHHARMSALAGGA